MTELKRELGPWAAAAIVVGTVIGSGIFIVPHDMVQRVGSAPWVFAVWVVGGLLSMAGALSYAELAASMPGAGGEYVYLRKAYGPLYSFIYGWTQMFAAKSGSIATLATAFFLYFATFRPAVNRVMFEIPLPLGEAGRPLPVTEGQLLAIVLIAGLAILNYFGVKVGGQVQVVVTVAKVGLFVAVVAFGLFSGKGDVANYSSALPSTTAGLIGFFGALRAALWAYDGWNNVAMVASEVREPQRNLPRALIYGTAAVMAIYIAANLAYFYVLPSADVAAHRLVAAEMMNRVAGPIGGDAVSIAAMVSIFAALNGSILTGSRVPYAMSADGYFFRAFSKVHADYATPAVSILCLSAWSALLVLSGRYDQLFDFVIFVSWILYGMATAAVLVLRRTQPDMPRPYRTLGYPVVPLLFVAVAAALTLSTLLDKPRESAIGIGIILAGLPFYAHWARKRKDN